MNEWKELEIDNLPPDILTEDYELMYRAKKGFIGPSIYTPCDDIKGLQEGFYDFIYRRKQKPAPTHEEIIKKWWEVEGIFQRVRKFTYSERGRIYKLEDHPQWIDKETFTRLESYNISSEE